MSSFTAQPSTNHSSVYSIFGLLYPKAKRYKVLVNNFKSQIQFFFICILLQCQSTVLAVLMIYLAAFTTLFLKHKYTLRMRITEESILSSDLPCNKTKNTTNTTFSMTYYLVIFHPKHTGLGHQRF